MPRRAKDDGYPVLLITTAKYLQYFRCKRYLGYQLHRDIDPSRTLRDPRVNFETDKVLELACALYPEGVKVSGDNTRERIVQTEMALQKRVPVFNAVLGDMDFIADYDILLPSGDNKWDIILVKASPTRKTSHIQEAQFKKWNAEHHGLLIDKCVLMHVNSAHVFDQVLAAEDFFITMDISPQVGAGYPDRVKNTVQEIHAISLQPEWQNLQRGCRTPKNCKAPHVCWSELGEGDIFKLREGHILATRYFEQGARFISEIPLDDEELSPRQLVQMQSQSTGEAFVDREEISALLARLRYPLYFLDFETINPVIPVYNKSRPYQHVPFQFSLHVVENEGDDPVHHGYIDDKSGDPRKEILERLSRIIRPGGTIVCFEETFEKKCLKESREVFDEYTGWYDEIIRDFLDLAVPFKNFHYYHPAQEGSTSLKKVISPLTHLSYGELDIRDGYAANFEFMKIRTQDVSDEEKNRILSGLEDYCRTDTIVLYHILESLKKL